MNYAAGTGLLGPKLNDLLQALILQDSWFSISPGKKSKQTGKLSISLFKAVQFLKKKEKLASHVSALETRHAHLYAVNSSGCNCKQFF